MFFTMLLFKYVKLFHPGTKLRPYGLVKWKGKVREDCNSFRDFVVPI